MLLFKDDVCIYIGTLNPIPHSHHAIEISIGVNSPLSVHINHQKVGNFPACIIAADCVHQIYIDPAEGEKITVIIDADHILARKLRQVFFDSGEKYAVLNNFLVASLIKKIEIDKLNVKNDGGQSMYNDVIEFLNKVVESHKQYVNENKLGLDPRIEKILREINSNIQKPRFVFSDFAKEVSLSESRLLHLFKDEVGIPFRRYVLWARLKKAVIEIQNGNSITQAAYAAGFSDAPHFSNIYTKMFGLKPSLPLKPSHFIK